MAKVAIAFELATTYFQVKKIATLSILNDIINLLSPTDDTSTENKGVRGGGGGQGCCSGESAQLPLMQAGFESLTQCHKWVEFVVGTRLAPKVSPWFSSIPPSTKTNTSKFQFDLKTVEDEPLREMLHCKVVLID